MAWNDVQYVWVAHSCAQASMLADGTKMALYATFNMAHGRYTWQVVALPNNITILFRPIWWLTVFGCLPHSYVPMGYTWQNRKPLDAAHHPIATTVHHQLHSHKHQYQRQSYVWGPGDTAEGVCTTTHVAYKRHTLTHAPILKQAWVTLHELTVQQC